jgi:hypothetical protein
MVCYSFGNNFRIFYAFILWSTYTR